MSAKLKKKLIAGVILAIVDVAMSTRLSAPRCRRGTSATRPKVLPSTGRACAGSLCVLIAPYLLAFRAPRLQWEQGPRRVDPEGRGPRTTGAQGSWASP